MDFDFDLTNMKTLSTVLLGIVGSITLFFDKIKNGVSKLINLLKKNSSILSSGEVTEGNSNPYETQSDLLPPTLFKEYLEAITTACPNAPPEDLLNYLREGKTRFGVALAESQLARTIKKQEG